MTANCQKVRLEDICSRIISGGTPKSTNAEFYEFGTVPWLDSKEVKFSRIYKTEEKITETGLSAVVVKWINKDPAFVDNVKETV